jgi:hypothetical protein
MDEGRGDIRSRMNRPPAKRDTRPTPCVTTIHWSRWPAVTTFGLWCQSYRLFCLEAILVLSSRMSTYLGVYMQLAYLSVRFLEPAATIRVDERRGTRSGRLGVLLWVSSALRES